MKRKSKKGRVTTILLLVIFIAGLSLLLYPTVANYWNSLHQTRAIASYADVVNQLDTEQYDEIWNAAKQYNADLLGRSNHFTLTDEQRAEYESLLDVNQTGIMGYIEIPTIGVSLPIYHGTSDEVLQIAVGHLDWSALPVGGEGTHCVLSGHRGLPSAKLFTNLDKLVEKDLFIIRVLDETLTYEVDQIRIVEPEVVSDLNIEEGEDYCTLVTCTPYGINTHRLLVRGHRIPTVIGNANVVSEAIIIEPLLVAPIVAIPILLALLIIVLTKGKNEKKRKHSMENGGIANE